MAVVVNSVIFVPNFMKNCHFIESLKKKASDTVVQRQQWPQVCHCAVMEVGKNSIAYKVVYPLFTLHS